MSSSSMRLGCDDWNTRIAKAAAEKKSEENSSYGVKISTLMCDFFVSEDVIPAHCKIHEKGILKRFNLSSVDKYELIMKEIFRKKHSDDQDEKTDISIIKKAMFSLLNVLNFNVDNESKLEQSHYNCATSGAVAYLFSALDNNPVYNDVLNSTYRKKFRTMVYHFSCISKIDKSLASHFYSHCRNELAQAYRFPELNYKVDDNERTKKSFIHSLIFCLDLSSIMYEWKDSVIEELNKIQKNFSQTLKYFNDNPALHSSGRFPQKTALAIRGNIIGLYVARLSSGAMSLLKNKTLEGIVNDKFIFAILTAEEKKAIQKKYGKFITTGNAFRHTELAFSALPAMFAVKIEIPKKESIAKEVTPSTPSSQIDEKKEDVSKIKPNGAASIAIPQRSHFFNRPIVNTAMPKQSLDQTAHKPRVTAQNPH